MKKIFYILSFAGLFFMVFLLVEVLFFYLEHRSLNGFFINNFYVNTLIRLVIGALVGLFIYNRRTKRRGNN